MPKEDIANQEAYRQGFVLPYQDLDGISAISQKCGITGDISSV